MAANPRPVLTSSPSCLKLCNCELDVFDVSKNATQATTQRILKLMKNEPEIQKLLQGVEMGVSKTNPAAGLVLQRGIDLFLPMFYSV